MLGKLLCLGIRFGLIYNNGISITYLFVVVFFIICYIFIHYLIYLYISVISSFCVFYIRVFLF